MASSGYFAWGRLKPAQKERRCRYGKNAIRYTSFARNGSAAQKERGHSYKKNGSKEDGSRFSCGDGCIFNLRRSGRSRANVVKLNDDDTDDRVFGSNHDTDDRVFGSNHDTDDRVFGSNHDTDDRVFGEMKA
jgi:hypothetical protein